MEKTLRETSLAEGKAEGMIEGNAEGIVAGMKIIAAKMKADGLPMGLIIKCINLTSDEINKL